MADVDATDALLVGGSGHFSVADPSAVFFEPLADLLRGVVESSHPTFGSCFGYQLLVAALGGRVEHDPDCSEVGSFEVELTDDGRADPIFAAFPDRFVAQMGHLDRAVELPGGVVNLVKSARCPYQALRVDGAPVWATQFHPELDQAANLHRYRAYIERYRPEDGDAEARFSSMPSPETVELLPRFLARVAEGRFE
jgi:GMP synthase (glutamine-hydrolysing)